MTKKVNFLLDVLCSYEDSLRRTGRTTRLAEKAVIDDCVLVHGYRPEAIRLSYEYDIQCITLEQYLNPEYHRGRKRTAYLFDSTAEDELIKSRLREINEIIVDGCVVR